MAPSSVWFTKQWQEFKFKELIDAIPNDFEIYLVGAKDDSDLCERLKADKKNVFNLCGKINLIESALLMKEAKRVFVNDSSPLHLASAVNAKTTAIFCSTIPEFGYFPLAEDSIVVQVREKLDCRPCGLHGKKSCPLMHYDCSAKIEIRDVIATI